MRFVYDAVSDTATVVAAIHMDVRPIHVVVRTSARFSELCALEWEGLTSTSRAPFRLLAS